MVSDIVPILEVGIKIIKIGGIIGGVIGVCYTGFHDPSFGKFMFNFAKGVGYGVIIPAGIICEGIIFVGLGGGIGMLIG